MATVKQQHYGLILSGDLIRELRRVLQEWSSSDDQALLAAYYQNGLVELIDGGGITHFLPQIEAVERGKPDEISIHMKRFTKQGRVHESGSETWSADALAAWVDDFEPSHIEVELGALRPLGVTVTLSGGSNALAVNSEVGYRWTYHGINGYEANGSPDVILDAIDAALTAFVQPAPSDPRGSRVFLGHGHGTDWRILEDKIKAAGFEPQAFEGSAGAGAVNIFVIDTVIRGSFAAVLYMTPDDTTSDGKKRARQNVIHEIGYAQGVLGIENVIVVQNDETEMPSNLDGVNVVRFKSNGLYEKLDEVVRHLSTIKARSVAGR